MKNIKISLYLPAILVFSLTLSCSYKTEVSGPTWDCGIGEGPYYLEADSDPDTTFNCNTQSRILVYVKSTIDSRYAGVHPAYLELYKFADTSIVGNWINMVDGVVGQILEIGGAIPPDTYDLILWMKNYQPNSTCPDYIYWDYPELLTQVIVTACSPPSKKMVIENDWQGSDTTALPNYNVFQFQDTSALRMAFHAVNTRDSIIPGTFLVQESIPYTEERIGRYIYQHKAVEDSNRMYLCGVKEFVDSSGQQVLLDILGATFVDTINGLAESPSDSTGSLIAVKSILKVSSELSSSQDPVFWGVNFKQFLESVVIHELGHQRAIIGHTGHISEFCIMHSEPIMPKWNTYYNLYSNPHFCETHMNVLKAVTW